MSFLKNDRVEYLGRTGVVVSATYNHVVSKIKYIDVYFEDVKQVSTVKVNELKKIK